MGLSPARTLREKSGRDVEDGVDAAVAQVLDGGGLVGVGVVSKVRALAATAWNISLSLTAGTPWSWSTTPTCDVLELAAEGVAEDDELRERHDDGDDDERGAAAEAAQVAFNDGQDAVHVSCSAGRPYRRADVAGGGLQGVAQLVAGVMDEDVVERGALDGERGDGEPALRAASISSTVVRGPLLVEMRKTLSVGLDARRLRAGP